MWVAVFQSTVDALAAPLLFLTVSRAWNRQAGFAASALYAALPAALMNARYVANIGVVPFLCAAAMCALVEFVLSGQGIFLALAVLAAGLAAQLHLTVGLLILPLGVVACLRWRKIDWRWLAGGAALAAIPLLPYVGYQLANGWPDLGPALGFVSAPKVTSLSALDMASSMLAGDIHGRVADVPLDPLGWLLLAAMLAGCVVAVRKCGLAGWVPVLFLTLPVLAAIRHSETVAPYYLLAILPAGAALFGVAAGQLRFAPAAFGLAALVLVVRAVPWFVFVNNLAAGIIPPDYPVPKPASYQGQLLPPRYSPPYNIPLRYSDEAAALAQRLSPGGPVYVGPRTEQDWVMDFITQDRFPFVGLVDRHTTLLPKSGAVLLVDGAGETMPWPLSSFADPLATVTPSPGHTIYTVERLRDGWLDRFDGQIGLQPVRATFAGGLGLQGYRVGDLSAGSAAPLLLEWRPSDSAANLARLHLFARLVDSAGKPWSSDADVALFEGTQWQPGSAILSQTDLTAAAGTPTGGYWLELGLYGDNPSSRVPVAVGGGAAANQLRLGPLRVSGSPPSGPPAASRAVFGADEIGLAAVNVEGGEVRLTWTALAKPKADYTAFVHVLDSAGRVIAQNDAPPGGDSFPTSLWESGDTVQDVRHFSASLAGAAKLEIGLYTQPDIRRLDVRDASGAALGTAYSVPVTGASETGVQQAVWVRVGTQTGTRKTWTVLAGRTVRSRKGYERPGEEQPGV
ncbi:MAG TPA: hypothetical protein VK009_00240, partial [Chloroflexota bacterium]|nr:hypothetical protein [Chloroflexota bacterium]